MQAQSPLGRGGGPSPRAGFTLIELLVVISVIAILSSMLLPAVARSKETGKIAACLNHLRQVGMASFMYADENTGRIPLQFPKEQDTTWASALSTNQYIKEYKVFLCPSYPPGQFKDWRRTYGVRLDPPTEYTSGECDEILHLDRVKDPVTYVHVADTTSRGRRGNKAQQYYYWRMLSENEVHARHLGGAIGLFLDGHAARLGRQQLENLGIQALYGPDVIPGYF